MGGVAVIFDTGHTRPTGIYKNRFHHRRQRNTVRIGHGCICTRIANIAQKVYTPHRVSVYGDDRKPMKPQQGCKNNQYKPQRIFQIILYNLHNVPKSQTTAKIDKSHKKKGESTLFMRFSFSFYLSAEPNIKWSVQCSTQMHASLIARFASPSYARYPTAGQLYCRLQRSGWTNTYSARHGFRNEGRLSSSRVPVLSRDM